MKDPCFSKRKKYKKETYRRELVVREIENNVPIYKYLEYRRHRPRMEFKCSQCESKLDPEHPLARKRHYNEVMQSLSDKGHLYTYHTVVPPFHRYVEKSVNGTRSLLGIMCQRQRQTMIRPVYILMTGLVEKVDIWLNECIVSPISDRSTRHGDDLGCGFGDRNITTYELLSGVRSLLMEHTVDEDKTALRSYGELIHTSNTKTPARSIVLTFDPDTMFFDEQLQDTSAAVPSSRKTLEGRVITIVCKYDLFSNRWIVLILRVHQKDEVDVAIKLINKFMYGTDTVPEKQLTEG